MMGNSAGIVGAVLLLSGEAGLGRFFPSRHVSLPSLVERVRFRIVR